MNLALLSAIAGLVLASASGVAIYWQRSEITSLNKQLDQSIAMQSICSASVKKLASEAIQQKSLSESSIKEAKRKAVIAQKSADKVLSSPASHPGDDCKSASTRAESWIRDRSAQK